MSASSETISRARTLRKRMTPPERRLWKRLGPRSPQAPSWRKQHPFGIYVLDFYCPCARLCVEVDGRVHLNEEQDAHDARRDAWLAERGVITLRIEAVDVLKRLDDVVTNVCGVAWDRAVARGWAPGESASEDPTLVPTG